MQGRGTAGHRAPERKQTRTVPWTCEQSPTHSWWRDLEGGADVGAARGVMRSFLKSSFVSLDLQGREGAEIIIAKELWRRSRSCVTAMGTGYPWREPKGWRAPATSMGIGLESHRAGPAPPQSPRAVLTGGRSASRPHRGHQGPRGWRTAHLGDRRDSSDTEHRTALPLRSSHEGGRVPRQLRGGSCPLSPGPGSPGRTAHGAPVPLRQPRGLPGVSPALPEGVPSPTPRHCPRIPSTARSARGPRAEAQSPRSPA